MDWIAFFARYPAYQISGHYENLVPDFRADIQWVLDTRYFNACSLFDRVNQIIENLKSVNDHFFPNLATTDVRLLTWLPNS